MQSYCSKKEKIEVPAYFLFSNMQVAVLLSIYSVGFRSLSVSARMIYGVCRGAASAALSE